MAYSPASEKRQTYNNLYIVAALVFALDQITKAWIFNNLELDTYWAPDSIPVIEGFFYIVHIGNEGAAWGMFSGQGTLLALFAVIALFAIFWFREHFQLRRSIPQLAFGLLIGGVIGNLVDRLVHGHVIDFLDFHLPFSIPYVLEGGRYPAFNVADCGIVIGVFLYLIYSFFAPETAPEEGDR